IVIAVGFVIAIVPPSFTGVRLVDMFMGVVWIVGMTNAFNLLDNVDGLAAGVALIASAFLVLALWPVISSSQAVALAAFLGATAGFLIYTFHPASIFMGDSGSLFLGFILSAGSVSVIPRDPRGASYAAVAILILLVPIFDTTFVTLTRLMTRRSP